MKIIKGFEGYSIDENGNIYTNKTNRNLKQSINKSGYNVVGLYKNKTNKTVYVHRIVAENYLPNPENKPQVNHINGIKTDNRLQNLEWATCSENTKHSFKIGLSNHSKLNLENRRLARIKLVLDLQTGIFYDSATDAANAKNITTSNLIQRLLGYRPNFTSLKYV